METQKETENTPSACPPERTLEQLAPVEGIEQFPLYDPAALAAQLETYGEARKVLVTWLLERLDAGIDYALIHKKVGARGNKHECPNAGNMIARTCEQCAGRSTL